MLDASTVTTTTLGLWAWTMMSNMSSCSLAMTLVMLRSWMWSRGWDVANMKPMTPERMSMIMTVTTRQVARRFRSDGGCRFDCCSSDRNETWWRRFRGNLDARIDGWMRGVLSSSASVVSFWLLFVVLGLACLLLVV